jgi:uncharacterized protein (TIGR03083 family)
MWPLGPKLHMQLPDPIAVLDLFADDRAALLTLLASLDADDWDRTTSCDGWSVKDVAGHILGGDLANLSRRRDGYQGDAPAPGQDLVSFLNGSNDRWMRAGRRLSPRLVCDLLAAAGPPLSDCFASLDLLALGAPVSWAGPAPAPVWLDVAREYTERWHHQQHIRDAVGQPGQTDHRFLHPVLATFAYALPMALQDTDASIGTIAHLHVTGEAGGDWSVKREHNGWQLYTGLPAAAAARVDLDQDRAWRLYTKGITPQEAQRTATFSGDHHLGQRLLDAVAIIA